MSELLLGTVVLALGYSLIPNHWLLFSVLAKAERWKQIDMIIIATIAVAAHLMGTILLAVLMLGLSAEIAHQNDVYIHSISPLFLVILGIWHLFSKHVVRRKKHWTYALSVILFFSPCLEIHRLFNSANAYGWDSLVFLTMLYVIVAFLSTTVLAVLSLKLLNLFRFNLTERGKAIFIGASFIVIGISSYVLH